VWISFCKKKSSLELGYRIGSIDRGTSLSYCIVHLSSELKQLLLQVSLRTLPDLKFYTFYLLF
jgi:hypothetical protein